MYDHGIAMGDQGFAMRYYGTPMVSRGYAMARCPVETPQSCHGKAIRWVIMALPHGCPCHYHGTTTGVHGRPWHRPRSFTALLWHCHGTSMYDHGIAMSDQGIAGHYHRTSTVSRRYAMVRCSVKNPQSCHGMPWQCRGTSCCNAMAMSYVAWFRVLPWDAMGIAMVCHGTYPKNVRYRLTAAAYKYSYGYRSISPYGFF